MPPAVPNPSDLTRHALSAVWGELPETEIAALRESITAVGVMQPVYVHEGAVVAGWHRHTVSLEENIPCEYINASAFLGKPEAEVGPADLLEIAVGENRARRHLSERDIARILVESEVAAGRQIAKRGRPRKTPQAAPDGKSNGAAPEAPLTAAEIADKRGISRRTAERAIADASGRGKPSGDAAIADAKKSAEAAKGRAVSAAERKRGKHAETVSYWRELCDQREAEIAVLKDSLEEAAGAERTDDEKAAAGAAWFKLEKRAEKLVQDLEAAEARIVELEGSVAFWKKLAERAGAALRDRDESEISGEK